MRLTWAGASSRASRIALAALSAALLSGCQVLGGSSGANYSVTVAVVPGIDNAPLTVGVDNDIFARYGLHVTIKDYPTQSAELQALTAGRAQLAAGEYTGFLYAEASDNTPLQLIADGYDTTANSVAILTLPGSPIDTAQKLEGATVATPPAQVITSTRASPFNFRITPYNFETLTAEQVLQSDGVSPSSVNWQQTQPGNLLSSLRSGAVQAILVGEPYILAAQEQLGAVELVDASSGLTSALPMSGYFSLDSYAKSNAAAVSAFQAALSAAQTECAQRGPVQGVLSKLPGMGSGAASLVNLGTYPASLNVGQVQRVATLMYESGMIKSALTISGPSTG
jgi:NitT/TauT family transport system substrate-binding protein